MTILVMFTKHYLLIYQNMLKELIRVYYIQIQLYDKKLLAISDKWY